MRPCRAPSFSAQVLSNPTKRQTYDDQRRAVKRKKQGFGPPPPSGVGSPQGHSDLGPRYQWWLVECRQIMLNPIMINHDHQWLMMNQWRINDESMMSQWWINDESTRKSAILIHFGGHLYYTCLSKYRDVPKNRHNWGWFADYCDLPRWGMMGMMEVHVLLIFTP